MDGCGGVTLLGIGRFGWEQRWWVVARFTAGSVALRAAREQVCMCVCVCVTVLRCRCARPQGTSEQSAVLGLWPRVKLPLPCVLLKDVPVLICFSKRVAHRALFQDPHHGLTSTGVCLPHATPRHPAAP